ncbi:PWWP domain-containing protein 2A [Hippocampus zosterae]|uniref:PWWP domain-containing protein 2A n=1 Tax=Hippocampus zosterae TaxID=109293 RepID=UPI00223D9CF9|nr:PWWP domain-containing protein 2A [Hippocampus zosterae]
MAAVATEPGAAAIRTTATTDDGSPESGPSGPGRTQVSQDPERLPEHEPAVELYRPRSGDSGNGEDRRHVRPEPQPQPEPAVGKVQGEAAGDPLVHDRGAGVSPGEAARNGSAQAAYPSILAQPKPTSSAVFLHSFPAAEAGLSLAEPAEPTTNAAGRDRGYAASVQPERRPAASHDAGREGDPEPEETCAGGGSPHPDGKPAEASAEAETGPCAPRLGACVQDLSLSLGSEVRVSLDHVIDDALVVSFRVGEKLFSGVLMDVSKRFGPYGIPVTPFPRRQDQSPPQRAAMPAEAAAPKQEAPAEKDSPPSCPWSAKPPPLFQEGAPYPPPLFIRDTYNQALPQPPPRKIKRPKRRYRCEEPTSIMNAIKLRPRQVLCDKCKGAAAAAGRRPGPVDLRGEEASRRRRAAEGPVSAEVKRLRSDDKSGRGDRRPPPGIRVSAAGAPASSRRVLRAVSSSSSIRLKLNSKKVLAKGTSADCAKKLPRNSQPPPPPPPPLGENQDREGGGKALTRAAALQNHNRNQKVHFTRRLQHPGASHTALPPRMRLKPQRYRTDDAQAPPSASSSSPPKHGARSASPSPAPRLAPAPTPLPSFCAGAEAPPPPPPPPPCPLPHRGLSESAEPPSSASPRPPSAEPRVGDEEGGEPKRRRKSSTSSSSSSSSSSTTSSSSAVSKSVSKSLLPDGRPVCVGDIVWAKIYGFPWWPARVLGITVARRAGGAASAGRQEARVSWFGSPTTSFLPLSQLSPFLESFQSRFDRKRKGPYRRAISEAASAAKQLTPEVRALLTQFET